MLTEYARTGSSRTLASVAGLWLQFSRDLAERIVSQSALYPINLLSLNLTCTIYLTTISCPPTKYIHKAETSFSFSWIHLCSIGWFSWCQYTYCSQLAIPKLRIKSVSLGRKTISIQHPSLSNYLTTFYHYLFSWGYLYLNVAGYLYLLIKLKSILWVLKLIKIL